MAAMDSLMIAPESRRFRKVSVDELLPGMYVHDLQVGWLSHPFWRRRFVIRDEAEIERIRAEPIREVVIDLSLGRDIDVLSNAPDPRGRERFADLDARFQAIARQRTERIRDSVSIEEERWRVRFLQTEALETVHTLMSDIRLGRQVDIQRAEPMVEKMMRSVLRHRDALIPLLQLKDHNLYSFQHSVSVAAMAVALGITLELDEETLRQTALASLLQDIGKARIPERILDKPGQLTHSETQVVQLHVQESQVILEDTPGVTDLMLQIVGNHHERVDGSGYPHNRCGDEVPVHAQLAAIVDVYDAITSDRPYQRRIEPTEALRKLYGMANSHFREDLLQAFIRTIGIYPVGSLLRLDNGLLAVVTEVNRHNLLKPVVRVMFDARSGRYVPPSLLDLGRRIEPPGIVGVESYARWGIDPRRWHPR
jgi:HD-GYP domain-containing protein (c-di-GMP phosphodiesterase class II)